MEPTKRKVVRRSPAHTVRLIHLPHLQAKPVEAESSLERDFVQIAALFPFITLIEHQPFRLTWTTESYTPDFLLRFKDTSSLVVEVKPQAKLEAYIELFGNAAAKLRAHGFAFMVALDTQIKQSSRASNALEIRRYAKTRYPQDTCEVAMALVGQHPEGLTFEELTAKHQLSRELMLHLVGRRCVTVDCDLSIGSQSSIYPIFQSKEGNHAIQFASWFDAEIWS